MSFMLRLGVRHIAHVYVCGLVRIQSSGGAEWEVSRGRKEFNILTAWWMKLCLSLIGEVTTMLTARQVLQLSRREGNEATSDLFCCIYYVIQVVEFLNHTVM